MATRNKLLADIVIAVGGTVTDPNNRNKLLEDWLEALTSAEQRIFIDLDPVANAFYSLATPITLTGNYSIIGDIVHTGTDMPIVGRLSSFNARYKVLPNGSVMWRPQNASGTEVSTPAGVVPLNKLSTIRVERTGSNGTITVDGVVEFSGAVPTGGCTIEVVGRSNTLYGDDILANVIINNNGTPASWNIDKATSNTETNNEGGNILTYNNIPTSDRELFQLNGAQTQWDNISPPVQQLPAVIVIA